MNGKGDGVVRSKRIDCGYVVGEGVLGPSVTSVEAVVPEESEELEE